MNEETLRERIIEASGRYEYNQTLWIETGVLAAHAEMNKEKAVLVELREWLKAITHTEPNL